MTAICLQASKKRTFIIEFECAQIEQDVFNRVCSPVDDDVSSITSAFAQGSLSEENAWYRGRLFMDKAKPIGTPLLCPILPRPSTSSDIVPERTDKKFKPLTPNSSTGSGVYIHSSLATISSARVGQFSIGENGRLCELEKAKRLHIRRKEMQHLRVNTNCGSGYKYKTLKFPDLPGCDKMLVLPPSFPNQLVLPKSRRNFEECPALMHFIHAPLTPRNSGSSCAAQINVPPKLVEPEIKLG